MMSNVNDELSIQEKKKKKQVEKRREQYQTRQNERTKTQIKKDATHNRTLYQTTKKKQTQEQQEACHMNLNKQETGRRFNATRTSEQQEKRVLYGKNRHIHRMMTNSDNNRTQLGRQKGALLAWILLAALLVLQFVSNRRPDLHIGIGMYTTGSSINIIISDQYWYDNSNKTLPSHQSSNNATNLQQNDDDNVSQKKVVHSTVPFDAAAGTASGGVLKPTNTHNLNLVFLGDSTCRHLFLSLSYYLLSGNHINTNKASRLLIEGGFPTRKEYEQYIYDAYNGTLQCDCYTPEGPFIPWGRTHKIWQNIYFHPSSNNEKDDSNDGNKNNVILTHITKPGYFEAHGHWEPSQIYDNHTYAKVVSRQQYPVGNFLWQGDWVDTIHNTLAKILPKPEYVVINAGLWPHDLNQTTLQHIRQALDDHNMIGIYKTTNKKMDELTTELRPHDVQGCDMLHHCLNISWTARVPQTEYMDPAHFGPNVNVDITKQLLDLLQNITKV